MEECIVRASERSVGLRAGIFLNVLRNTQYLSMKVEAKLDLDRYQHENAKRVLMKTDEDSHG